eukprot:m.232399 g.232399  ORF g.232399 m.232399 type:complete len:73 (-) comp17373_c0_seq14:668-886(-)
MAHQRIPRPGADDVQRHGRASLDMRHVSYAQESFSRSSPVLQLSATCQQVESSLDRTSFSVLLLASIVNISA